MPSRPDELRFAIISVLLEDIVREMQHLDTESGGEIDLELNVLTALDMSILVVISIPTQESISRPRRARQDDTPDRGRIE